MNYLQEFRTVSETALMAGFQHDCDNRIKPILKETGLRTGADRVIVFEMADSAVISATHEWCNNGIPRQIIPCRISPATHFRLCYTGLKRRGD
ncbi:MAG: hypothetical protein IPJ37_03935 [Bacteroidales bacterium]|nr:hypothetical protein [Bacteroidales bacterium]